MVTRYQCDAGLDTWPQSQTAVEGTTGTHSKTWMSMDWISTGILLNFLLLVTMQWLYK